MSIASECDKCGALFKATKGCVTLIDIAITNAKGSMDGWGEIEFCPGCSAQVLAVIGLALDGLHASDDPAPQQPGT